jgi:hypothetical protein
MVICNGTGWYVLDLCTTLNIGGINTNDWTNRHLGNSQCPYDGLSGTFTVGEVITEATSGNTGIIMSDSGSLLVLKNVTGTGFWTNDRQITGGTSGATANVNVGTSTKNTDTNITHNFGVNITNLIIEMWIYENATFAGATARSVSTPYANSGTLNGVAKWGVDTNSVKMQTGGTSILTLADDGLDLTLDNEDYSYSIIVKWII